uniref:Integral membrane protein n=1 Tax=Streptomyces sp. NBC_01401 TaxID=2903854 RepID=A0AAU3GQZ2_9ACTN
MDTTGTTGTTRTKPPTGDPAGDPAALRKLYFLRFAFAAVWAALLFATADTLGPLSTTLLVIYPLFDVACAVVDARSARANGGPVRGLYVNIALSTLTGIALAVAATSGIPGVLRVWGVWAVTAGLVQLVVGALRRRLGGQWAMIASGAISTLAGSSFVAQAGADDATLSNLAGYAFLGGVFFLVSALRLKRTAGN